MARATKNAVAGLLPTQRNRSVRHAEGDHAGVARRRGCAARQRRAAAAGPVAPMALDASPIDRLDQADWPTPRGRRAQPEPAERAPTRRSTTRADVAAPMPAPADTKHAALAGSILAPDTWRQAVRSLQDRTVRR